MDNDTFKSGRKIDVAKEFYLSKTDSFLNPLYFPLIMVVIVLLPAFVSNENVIKVLTFGLLGTYILICFGAVLKRLDRKLDLLFEMLLSKDDGIYCKEAGAPNFNDGKDINLKK